VGVNSIRALVELRQYTLRPGRRDELIELFTREFVAEHERVGALVLDCFRDLDNPDRFVWLRGFPDYSSRPAALERLYGGELWARRRETVNAMLLDSDDVLQLCPLDQIPRANGAHLVVALILLLDQPIEQAAAAGWVAQLASRLPEAGGTPLGTLVSDPRPNNFPRLPLRERDHALVVLASFADLEAADAWARERTQLPAPAGARLHQRPIVLRLAPA
jgi:hypothetical protein